MKKLGFILTLIGLISFTGKSYAQSVIGVWYNKEKDAKIKIYKTKKDIYEGKIVWLKNPLEDGKPKRDTKNKDRHLRSRKLMGLKILTGFTKSGNQYVDGKIYDPKSGNTYSCKITPKSHNELKIRGYIGISLFGRTDIWTRADK